MTAQIDTCRRKGKFGNLEHARKASCILTWFPPADCALVTPDFVTVPGVGCSEELSSSSELFSQHVHLSECLIYRMIVVWDPKIWKAPESFAEKE